MTIHVDNGNCLYHNSILVRHYKYLDTDGMISQALLVGNFEAAVDISVGANRMVRRLLAVITT